MKKQSFFGQAILAITAILGLIGMIAMVRTINDYSIQLDFHSTLFYLLAAIFIFILFVLAVLIMSWTSWQTYLFRWIDVLIKHDKWRRMIAWLVSVSLPFIFIFAILHPTVGKLLFSGFWQRLALFWCLALVGMFCARILKKELSWLQALGVAILILAVLYRIAIIFSTVSDYPFTRVWSEGSRYYGASLFFSQHLYGSILPLPVMHPAWHLLLTPPFLFGDLPIWVHRLWNAILQVGLNFGLGLVVVRHFRLRDRFQFWLAAGWAFLFLLQGLILIHLLACALIVVLGTQPNRFWRTTLTILAASIWAGLCRINWFPVPALIASVIYLLEIPVFTSKRWLIYLWKPAFWFGLGTSVAFAINILYMNWSGNGNGGNFGSSLTSDLLWYRLLPNPTYPHGVLPDLLLVTLPLILIIAFALRQGQKTFHPIRLIGVFGILLVLCAGGIVVSAKIGGGSNLHNLDAYLILLMLVGGYFFFRLPTPEPGKAKPIPKENFLVGIFLLIFVVSIPVGSAIQYGKSIFTWDHSQVEDALAFIKNQTETAASQGGEVLFMSQRHLVSLGMIDVPLVPDYELAFLMEMVMSHNRAYLDRFQADLQQQRFALIIAEEQNIHFDGRTRAFGEENDLWVQEVSIPIVCYYSPLYESRSDGFVLFVPRDDPCK